MASVIRDFIPAGEKLTAAEKRRLVNPPWTRSGAEPKAAVKPDFVPDKKHKLIPSDPEESARRALASTERSMAREAQTVYERAKAHLAKMDARESIEVIRVLSGFERDMYLTAEKFNAGRKDILDAFPPPDPSFEERVPAGRAREGDKE